jgi:hypothetical protein
MLHWIRLLIMLMLPLAAQGCASNDSVAMGDTATGLTLRGSSGSLDAFLRSADTMPHRWVVEKRWLKEDGSQAIRLRWPERPAPSDLGSIVWLAQVAHAEGLVISDTQIVETQR